MMTDEFKAENILTKDLVNEQIEKAQKAMVRIKESYERGFITRQERNDRILDAFESGFSRFLNEKGLCLQLNSDNFHQFTEDYCLYKNGDVMTASSWLAYRSKRSHAVSAEDKRLFFH